MTKSESSGSSQLPSPSLPSTAAAGRGRSWARPSELHRALACPASTVLPRAEDDEPGKAAEWGQEVHRWVETGEATPRVAKWLEEITDDAEGLRQGMWPGGMHEVPVSIASATSLDAEYLEPPCEDGTVDSFFTGKLVRGLADWIGTSVVPHIVDIKTGRNPPESPPGELPQLLFYALAWLRCHPDEPGVFLSIDHWPRYPKGQPPTRIGPDYVTREDVETWWREVVLPAYQISQREGAKDDARPGDHCRYCRSAFYCPANK